MVPLIVAVDDAASTSSAGQRIVQSTAFRVCPCSKPGWFGLASAWAPSSFRTISRIFQVGGPVTEFIVGDSRNSAAGWGLWRVPEIGYAVLKCHQFCASGGAALLVPDVPAESASVTAYPQPASWRLLPAGDNHTDRHPAGFPHRSVPASGRNAQSADGTRSLARG